MREILPNVLLISILAGGVFGFALYQNPERVIEQHLDAFLVALLALADRLTSRPG